MEARVAEIVDAVNEEGDVELAVFVVISWIFDNPLMKLQQRLLWCRLKAH